MAISKPSWLRSLLDRLNWDILTWKVYVGDAVESGIDWALGWINWAIYQGEQAWNKAVAAWDKAVEIGQNLLSTINLEVGKLWAKLDTWWSDLGNWWEAKKTLVLGWIDAAKSTLKSLIAEVELNLNKLGVKWDNFWTISWPQLLKDFNALLVKVGNFFAVTLPGLASRKDVDKAIADDKLTWKDLWNFWGDFGKEVTTFFSDPLAWLLDKIEEMLARFW